MQYLVLFSFEFLVHINTINTFTNRACQVKGLNLFILHNPFWIVINIVEVAWFVIFNTTMDFSPL